MSYLTNQLVISQISEFSIVLVVLAASTGLVGDKMVTVITLVALTTILLSTYMMQYDTKLYRLLERRLSIFERSDTKRELKALKHYPLVLLGYRKGGHEFVHTFRQMKKEYVVIDYDPDVIEELGRRRINHIYGDVTDLELLEEIGVHHSELVISTISDMPTNLLLAEHITGRQRNALFICHAHSYDDAEMLYQKGASYVILPHFIGTEQISSFILRHGNSKSAFQEYRQRHLVAIGRTTASP